MAEDDSNGGIPDGPERGSSRVHDANAQDTDGLESLMEVSRLFDDTIQQSIDEAELGSRIGDALNREDVDEEEFHIPINHIESQVESKLEEILEEYRVLYANTSSIYLELPKSDWTELFGVNPPGDLETWGRIHQLYESDLKIAVQADQKSEAENLQPLTRVERAIDDSGTAILGIDCSPAVFLDAVGAMSKLQARAWILGRMGYKNREIAEIMDKNVGTVSSHRNRGRKAAIQIQNAHEIISPLDEE